MASRIRHCREAQATTSIPPPSFRRFQHAPGRGRVVGSPRRARGPGTSANSDAEVFPETTGLTTSRSHEACRFRLSWSKNRADEKSFVFAAQSAWPSAPQRPPGAAATSGPRPSPSTQSGNSAFRRPRASARKLRAALMGRFRHSETRGRSLPTSAGPLGSHPVWGGAQGRKALNGHASGHPQAGAGTTAGPRRTMFCGLPRGPVVRNGPRPRRNGSRRALSTRTGRLFPRRACASARRGVRAFARSD